jgi:hypothetical protein
METASNFELVACDQGKSKLEEACSLQLAACGQNREQQ